MKLDKKELEEIIHLIDTHHKPEKHSKLRARVQDQIVKLTS